MTIPRHIAELIPSHVDNNCFHGQWIKVEKEKYYDLMCELGKGHATLLTYLKGGELRHLERAKYQYENAWRVLNSWEGAHPVYYQGQRDERNKVPTWGLTLRNVAGRSIYKGLLNCAVEEIKLLKRNSTPQAPIAAAMPVPNPPPGVLTFPPAAPGPPIVLQPIYAPPQNGNFPPVYPFPPPPVFPPYVPQQSPARMPPRPYHPV